MRKVPYSSGLPLVGHLLSYQKDRLALIKKLRDEMGPIFKLKVGPKVLTVTVRPEDVQQVMHTNLDNYIKKTNFDKIFGQGIFTANGESWKAQRKVFQPLFVSSYIEKVLPIMLEVAEKHIDGYLKENHGKKANIQEMYAEMTFDIIIAAIIGIDFRENFKQLHYALNFVADYLTKSNYWPGVIEDIIGIKAKQEYEHCLGIIDEIIYKSIDDQKSEKNESSIVSLLLNEKEKTNAPFLTDKGIRDQIVALLFAGYETTALTMGWGSTVLGQNAILQEELRQEYASLNWKEELNRETLSKLVKSESFLAEVVRLYPPGWAWTRFAVKDDKLGDFEVKAGDIILIVPYWMHREARYFDRPFDFDAKRFLGDKVKQVNKFAYIPFGAGPRQCIGKMMGLLEMKIILGVLLEKVSLSEADMPKEAPLATLHPDKGFWVKAARRN